MNTNWRRGILGSVVALVVIGIMAWGAVAFAKGGDNGHGQQDDHGQDGKHLDSRTFSFGLWGDMPYAKNGDNPKIPNVTADMNASDIRFSVYDGDIKDGSSLCTDDVFSNAIDMFNTLKKPAVYVPGDNEWTDCHRTNNRGYNNLERLDYLRQTMFSSADSFGQQTVTLEHQGPSVGSTPRTPAGPTAASSSSASTFPAATTTRSTATPIARTRANGPWQTAQPTTSSTPPATPPISSGSRTR
jgi:hypothetical protein